MHCFKNDKISIKPASALSGATPKKRYATEATVATEVASAAEVVPEKTEWTEPAKAEKKRSYRRSEMASPVSNEQRYFASRIIRKRQPTATISAHKANQSSTTKLLCIP